MTCFSSWLFNWCFHLLDHRRFFSLNFHWSLFLNCCLSLLRWFRSFLGHWCSLLWCGFWWFSLNDFVFGCFVTLWVSWLCDCLLWRSERCWLLLLHLWHLHGHLCWHLVSPLWLLLLEPTVHLCLRGLLGLLLQHHDLFLEHVDMLSHHRRLWLLHLHHIWHHSHALWVSVSHLLVLLLHGVLSVLWLHHVCWHLHLRDFLLLLLFLHSGVASFWSLYLLNSKLLPLNAVKLGVVFALWACSSCSLLEHLTRFVSMSCVVNHLRELNKSYW